MAGRRSFARRPPPGGIVHQSGHDDSGPAIAAVPGNQAWPSRCRPGWSRISQPAEDPGIPSLRQQTPAQIMRTASPSGCKLKLTTNSEVLPPHSHETGSAARASAGPGAAPADCPSGAAVSGPDLPAPYLREEDPPCCRRWRRARDALRARALRRRHGSGAGQAGGRCIMSRAGALYIIAAIDEAAAGRGPGVPARRAAAHQAPAAGRPGGSMLVRARGMLAAVRRSISGGRRGRPGLGAAAQPD